MLSNKSWRLAIIRALSLAGKPLSGGEQNRLGKFEYIQWEIKEGMIFLAPPLCTNGMDVVIVHCSSKLQQMRFKWELRGEERYFGEQMRRKYIKDEMRKLACK